MIKTFFTNTTSPIWKQIPDYPNYLVSNDGRVWSVHSKREIKPLIEKRGRNHDQQKSDIRYTLCKDGKPKKFFAARLVLSAFFRLPEDGEQVDHIDQNPMNNKIENLRWISPRENQDNRTGYYKQGIICVETGQVFNSAVQAEYIITGNNVGHGSHIISAANGKRKTAYGFHWEHID